MIGGWGGELGCWGLGAGGSREERRLQKASQMAVRWLAQAPTAMDTNLTRKHTHTHTQNGRVMGIKSKAGRRAQGALGTEIGEGSRSI